MLAIVDADTGKLADPPDFLVRGFAHEPTRSTPPLRSSRRPWPAAAPEGIGDPHQLEQLIGRDIGRWAHRKFRRSPLIIPIVIDA